MDDFYIDALTPADREGLIDIIKSGADYPFWYRKTQSADVAADEYVAFLKHGDNEKLGALSKSGSLYKAVRTSQGRLIGCVYLTQFDKESCSASLSYFFHAEVHGKKLGSRAVFQVVQDAVLHEGLKALHATCHPEKIASLKILLNLGFRVSGFLFGAPFKERDGSPAPRVILSASPENLAEALKRLSRA